MPKIKTEDSKRSPLFEALRKIECDNPELIEDDDRYNMVDIMTFCSDPVFLGIPYDEDRNTKENEKDPNEEFNMEEVEFKIFPGQAVILKAFYKGTIGNEDLKLSQSEWEWLYERQDNIEIDGVTYERNLRDVINKLHEKEKAEKYNPFTQLVLVLGRRATKCRSEDDLIATTEGSLTFRDLCDRLNLGEKIGICTYDTNTWQRSVTYDIKAKDNGKVGCYKLTTSSGIEEISSWNHPYLILRENFYKPQFVQLKDLKRGDKIAVACKTEIFGNGKISHDKYVVGEFPKDVLLASKQECKLFLKDLFTFDCDNRYYKFNSIYVDVVKLTKHVLLKFGIHSRINYGFNKDYFELIIENKNSINIFNNEINDDISLEITHNPNDIMWEYVKSVDCVGIRKTVDLQVDPHHVIGGDIISHNTFLASIITAYEAYKLLVINNGDPHRYYNLPDDDEIAIINVALSQKQAGRLFGQVQARIRNSPFFQNRVAKETADSVRLYTDRDLQKKQSGANLSVPGSILLLCGHSNPDSLAGYSAILLLFDEIAFYDETGKVTGKYFVNRLKPSLSKFYKYKAGKVVMISSPNNRNGAFYDAFSEATSSQKSIADSCVSFQLPTWDMNLDVSYLDPEMVKERNSNPEMFTVEFGAQWSTGGAYGNYFEEGAVERCLRFDIGPHTRPQPATNYYIHVDPAKKSNNYAAVMVAKKRYVTPQGQRRIRCSLAGTWLWKPTPGLGLLFDDIDKEIIRICSIFHPMSVTYDDYHSVHSVQLLRRHGINCLQIAFNDRVKCKVYQNLRNMMLYQPEPEIILYDHNAETNLLIAELKELKFKKTKRGYTILPDKNGDVGLDDLSDCLAGAVWAANEGLRMALPTSALVHTGWT